MSSFPTLRQRVLRAQAGNFDGVRTQVFFDNAGLALVAHHEQLHERITHLLPDGKLLLVTSLLLRSTELPYLTRRIVQANQLLLFDETRYAQECFATYISVHNLSHKDITKGMQLLDNEYLHYYQSLGNCFDSVARSSYLRYVLAWGLCAACFSSPVIRRICGRDLLKPINLSEEENPSTRLCRFLAIDHQPIIMAVVAEIELRSAAALAPAGATVWDLHSETEWIGADLSQAGIVERIAIESATRLFSQHIHGGCVSDEESYSWANRTGKELSEFIHYKPIDRAATTLPARLLESPEDLMCWAQARSSIENKPFSVEISDAYYDGRLDISLLTRIWLVPEDVQRPLRDWLMAVESNTGVGESFFRLSTDVALDVLSAKVGQAKDPLANSFATIRTLAPTSGSLDSLCKLDEALIDLVQVLRRDTQIEEEEDPESLFAGGGMNAMSASVSGPDVNHDGVVDSSDLVMFTESLVGGAGLADYDGDGEVTAEDTNRYLTDYSQGG